MERVKWTWNLQMTLQKLSKSAYKWTPIFKWELKIKERFMKKAARTSIEGCGELVGSHHGEEGGNCEDKAWKLEFQYAKFIGINANIKKKDCK